MPHRDSSCNRTRPATDAAATARNRYPTTARVTGWSVDRARAWQSPVVDGSIERHAASQSVVPVVRAGLPNRLVVVFVFVFLGVGPCGVFLGELEKTLAQGRIGAVAGEAAATLGLFAKVERLRHRTHSLEAGVPLRGSQSPAPIRIVAGTVQLYRFYVR